LTKDAMLTMAMRRAPRADASRMTWCHPHDAAYRLTTPVTTHVRTGTAPGLVTDVANGFFTPGTRAPEEVLT